MFGSSTPKVKHGHKIVENVYYFGEFPNLDCSMYILKNAKDELMLIDTGNGLSFDPFIEGITKLGLTIKNIKQVLITHEHLDHVLGLYVLMSNYKNSELKIYAHPTTASILQEGDEDKICPGALGISAAMFGVEIKPLSVEILNLKEGHKFGNFNFQLFETPGHSLGSISFYEPQQKLLFPGDVVFPQGSFGRYDFPGGSLSKLQNSIKILSELDVSYLCAGHMDAVANGTKHIKASLKNIMSMSW
jgi:glyoxylase-like metal-dependent hydrolase (beta-lactamase superfamily II)